MRSTSWPAAPAWATSSPGSGCVDETLVRYAARPEADPSDLDPIQLREDVDTHLRYLRTAVLLDDATVYGEYIAWSTEVHEARGLPTAEPHVIADLLGVIVDERGHEAARDILRRGPTSGR